MIYANKKLANPYLDYYCLLKNKDGKSAEMTLFRNVKTYAKTIKPNKSDWIKGYCCLINESIHCPQEVF